MSRMTLLVQLLPLLVFLIVDAFVEDVRISVGAAIVFAVAQLAVTYWRTKRFDWFVLLDAALIAGMGGVSIALKDELFFKLKPAIIEGVTIALMVALILSPDSFLAAYVGRMTPGMELKPEALSPLRKVFAWSCVCVGAHIAAVLYTAFYASKSAWAAVSGPGFYLALLPVLAGALRRAWKARRSPTAH